MACSCKSNQKIDKMLYKSDAEYKKKGAFALLNSISTSFVNKLVLVILLILLTPIVFLVILCNLLFKDKLAFTFPKFITKYLKNKKNE